MLGFLDDGLKEELPIWRLITERVASKEEIERSYTFNDILKANAVLDMKGSIESEIGKILAPKIEEK